MKKIKNSSWSSLIKVAPFLLLVSNGASILFYDQEWAYDYLLYIQYQLNGHGVIVLLVYIYFAHRLRFCLYTKIALYGLLATNVVNILSFFFESLRGAEMISEIIVATFLLLCLIAMIAK